MMDRLADRVLADRAVRNQARSAFDMRLAQIKADLEERGIAGRVADKVSEEARDALDEAMQVAGESKGVIAGTAAALAIWFLRNPIIAWLDGILGDGSETEGIFTDDGE